MATTVYGEFVSVKHYNLLTTLILPVAQITGTVSNLAAGINHNVVETGLGAVTNNYNQAPFGCPQTSSIYSIVLMTWGASPTAGTITTNINSFSTGAIAGTAIAANNYYNYALLPNALTTLTANTRHITTVSTAGWTQSSGGVTIQMWGTVG